MRCGTSGKPCPTGPWSAWSSLAGGITSDPAAAVNTDGRLEVFARGTDDALWHIWQTVPHAGPWSAWGSLAGGITSDAVVVNSDGRIEVFARGTDNALWHIWQTAPGAGPWSAWGSLAGTLISPAVYLGLNEQHQQQTEWCWLATTTSITLYYTPSTRTQCSLANTELGQTTCCMNGSSNVCNKPGYPDKALTTTGHLASTPGRADAPDHHERDRSGTPGIDQYSVDRRRRPQPRDRRLR